MNDNASALAEELRAICEDWERDIKGCLLWADARATNQHHKRLAALVIRRSISEGYLPSLMSIDSVAAMDGYMNWHLLRCALGIESVAWLGAFDSATAPPNKKRWIKTLNLVGDDSNDEDEFDEADAWKRSDEPHKPLAGTTLEDKTADQLRGWYVEQAKAWQTTLATAAKQIGGDDSQESIVGDDWNRSIAGLSSDQKELALALRKTASGLTYSEMLLIESAFPEGASTTAAARMKKARIAEVWEAIRPRSNWQIIESGKSGRESCYKAVRKNEL